MTGFTRWATTSQVGRLRIDGCSQSEVSSSHHGELTLRLLPGSRAELTYDGTSFETYASRVDDLAGQHRGRERAVWSGEALSEKGAILIRLTPKSVTPSGSPS